MDPLVTVGRRLGPGHLEMVGRTLLLMVWPVVEGVEDGQTGIDCHKNRHCPTGTELDAFLCRRRGQNRRLMSISR
jgi:hypothetical protein